MQAGRARSSGLLLTGAPGCTEIIGMKGIYSRFHTILNSSREIAAASVKLFFGRGSRLKIAQKNQERSRVKRGEKKILSSP
jgi:hypothetical protein